MWRILILLLLEINIVTKFLLFRAKYIIDWIFFIDIYNYFITSQCVNKFIHLLAVCKSGNGESGNGIRGVRGMRVIIQGIGMGLRGIWVRMRGMGLGMREICVEI